MDTFSERELEQLEERFADARRSYGFRKETIERTVREWAWFTSPSHDPRPLYFEREGDTPGRRLRREPKSIAGKYHIGFDSPGKLVVERIYVLPDACYETFIFSQGEVVELTRYDYSSEKGVVSVAHIKYDMKGRMLWYALKGREGSWREEYFWREALLTRVEVSEGGRVDKKLLGIYQFKYAPNGVLRLVSYESPNGTIAEHRSVPQP